MKYPESAELVRVNESNSGSCSDKGMALLAVQLSKKRKILVGKAVNSAFHLEVAGHSDSGISIVERSSMVFCFQKEWNFM